MVDSVAWARETLLPSLSVSRRVGSVALHPPCATRHLGLDADLASIAGRARRRGGRPRRGHLLRHGGRPRGCSIRSCQAAALEDARAELGSRSFDAHLCSNRTCEIGLAENTGRDYRSFVFLLEELTR